MSAKASNYVEIGMVERDGDEDRVISQGETIFCVKAGLGAEALRLQNRCWRLQGQRRYTAASRVSVEIQELEGYRE